MPNPIEDDPKLAQAVGVLAGRFGLVEIMVEMLFSSLTGCTERRATILFSFFKGVPTQCDVIKFLAKTHSAIDDILYKRLTDILVRYSDLAALRNGIIHYPFGWDTALETPTIYKMRRTRTGPEVWVKDPTGHETVNETSEKIQALFQDVIALQTDVSAALREASLQKLKRLSPGQTPEQSILNLLLGQSDNEEQPHPPQSSET